MLRKRYGLWLLIGLILGGGALIYTFTREQQRLETRQLGYTMSVAHELFVLKRGRLPGSRDDLLAGMPRAVRDLIVRFGGPRYPAYSRSPSGKVNVLLGDGGKKHDLILSELQKQAGAKRGTYEKQYGKLETWGND